MLVIIPNMAWVNLHGDPAYSAIMDIFATNGLQQNQRRDRGSRFIFSFKDLAELYAVRDRIKSNNLAPTAFCISPDLLRHYQTTIPITQNPPNIQQISIGKAWIISRI
jgi:hypothetical protein